jgi:surfeit locus 1 family protein
VLLVDRGWVPLVGFREHLPDVHFAPPATVAITGRLENLPAPGLALGRMPPPPGRNWPKLTSYPDMTQLAHALGTALAKRIVLLDPTSTFGYVRDWQPPGMSPVRNLAYAVQWWGFAVTLVIIWGVLSAPKSRNSPSRAAH